MWKVIQSERVQSLRPHRWRHIVAVSRSHPKLAQEDPFRFARVQRGFQDIDQNHRLVCGYALFNRGHVSELKHDLEVAAVTPVVVAEEDAVLGVGDVVVDGQRIEVICYVEGRQR